MAVPNFIAIFLMGLQWVVRGAYMFEINNNQDGCDVIGTAIDVMHTIGPNENVLVGGHSFSKNLNRSSTNPGCLSKPFAVVYEIRRTKADRTLSNSDFKLFRQSAFRNDELLYFKSVAFVKYKNNNDGSTAEASNDLFAVGL